MQCMAPIRSHLYAGAYYLFTYSSLSYFIALGDLIVPI